MVFWGSVSALMALVKTPAQLIGVRFLLGVTEAGFSPAVLFIISTWYRRHEQSKRFMCFLSAGILSGAFGGIIAGAIVDSLDGSHGIAGWQWYVPPFLEWWFIYSHVTGSSSSRVSPQLPALSQLPSSSSTTLPTLASLPLRNARWPWPAYQPTLAATTKRRTSPTAKPS